MTQRILVVEDEPKIRMIVRGYLEADGFEVLEAVDGPSGLAATLAERPDLVVLDLMLPGLDGFEVLRRLRPSSEVPVIMLTARAEEIDRVMGFTAGADDYVTKPFSPRELALRVRAVLKRSAAPADDSEDLTLRFAGLSLDPVTRTITVDDIHTPRLTALDFDLLHALARSPRRVFTRAQLLRQVWGDDFFGDERVVDVHIRTIRRELGDDASNPRFVATVRAVGYQFIARKPE
jgi:DNA-binding response OmpR family regulator